MSSLQRPSSVRVLESLPGIATWITLIGAPIVSFYRPEWVAVYIILFDLYWFLKGGNVALHLMHSYRLLRFHNTIDWMDWSKRLSNRAEFEKYLAEKLGRSTRRIERKFYADHLRQIQNLPVNHDLNWGRLYHLIIFPTYKEDVSVLKLSIDSYVNVDYPLDKVIFVLATEERGGADAQRMAEEIEKQYKDKFLFFLKTVHPDGLVGEVRGKAGNMNHAVLEALKELDRRGIRYEDVIVSTLDADTIIMKNYFSHLTYDFLTEEKPLQTSYQPLPVYHNNIWDTPAIPRLVATSSSFWQLVEASRPDRLITFSSHAMSLKTLVDVNLFRQDSINEDSFIFWQCFMHFDGDYKTKPLFTTTSMDAVMGTSYVDSLFAQYKQKRRWAYGVSQISYVVDNFLHNKKIPLWKRLLYAERFIEGHYFWATASIMIVFLGWAPLIIGHNHFSDSVLAVNLPFMTRTIMTTAMVFLLFSVYINAIMLPKRPKGYPRWKSVSMLLQWLLTPVVSPFFGSLPAIDAQTRLLFGKYMEFWVTPKVRKVADINSEPVKLNN
jgi:cellulose synthase/poly-beta-1,6-N-acetylglucosamine synthase-like glycosyltransferase